jgi:hypothetical protein
MKGFNMSSVEEMNVSTSLGFSSLMDLAAFDTSDLKAQVSRLARQGIYIVELKKAQLVEVPPQDPADPISFRLNLSSDILQFVPLDKNETVEDMAGRSLNESFFLSSKDIKEAIQLLMGRYKTVGFRCKGTMGGVEGSEPGWIDEGVGKRIVVRVRHYTNKQGQDQAAFDWLSAKQMEKLEIPVEVLARDFLDEAGNPIDVAA